MDTYDSILEIVYNNSFSSSNNNHTETGWTNIKANDYATSTIRRYINGTDVQKGVSSSSGTYSPSGETSSMFTDLNIDPENDYIYNKISERSLSNLYSNMANSTTGGSVTYPSFTSNSINRSTSDKFWLLSYNEVYELLGDGNASTASDDRAWAEWYWLRSPASTNSSASVVDRGGEYDYNMISYRGNAARPAFQLSI